MRRLLPFSLLAVMFMLQAARAQEAGKKPEPKAAVSPSQALLDNWNDIGRKLIAMAEDFPEDKYDFKPTPAQRSFAEQLLHVANANYFFLRETRNGGSAAGGRGPEAIGFQNKG